jgi:spermidine synthase
MNRRAHCWMTLALAGLTLAGWLRAEVVYETTSPYHHILVADERGTRTLYFDNAMESRMSLRDPLQGHFEYTEFFHLAWLWNERITNVLMIGLGGGSVPRAFQHFYPKVMVECVELDPKVIKVARDFFSFKESPTCKVIQGDGRVHLRRSRKKYDLIIMDAYTAGRYGSSIPYSLVTKEFFALASDHLSDNGLMAYNVIATLRGAKKLDVVAALHHTVNVVFPQVYRFYAASSRNVVLFATRSAKSMSLSDLETQARELARRKVVTLPGLPTHLRSFQTPPLEPGDRPLILSDDFAPLDGMLGVEP